MNENIKWWLKPRTISVVVDNLSWVLPYAIELVDKINRGGDTAILCRSHKEINNGDVAFYFGCVHITPKNILDLNRRNLVVHASELPKGKGFSPLTWQVLEGESNIPVCLFEAVEKLDAGPIIYKDYMSLDGDELLNGMREKLGTMHVDLGWRFLNEESPLDGVPQSGEESIYKRRSPKDSEIDPGKSLKEQFNLLRVVDNQTYPAFFYMNGCRYKLTIEKMYEK